MTISLVVQGGQGWLVSRAEFKALDVPLIHGLLSLPQFISLFDRNKINSVFLQDKLCVQVHEKDFECVQCYVGEVTCYDNILGQSGLI